MARKSNNACGSKMNFHKLLANTNKLCYSVSEVD